MDLHYQSYPVLHFERLTPQGVDKTTFHLEIGWDPSLSYRCGDSVAIKPHNCPHIVKRVLERVQLPSQSQQAAELELTRNWSLTRVGGKLLRFLFNYQMARRHQDELEAAQTDKEVASRLIDHHDVEGILEYFDALITSDHWSEALMPLLPRFYSIASSFQADPSRLAITVAHVDYYHHRPRLGVCTDYLYRIGQQSGQHLEAAIHPTRDFLLPNDDSSDIIMIGPGTGVAPYRAFMQQRLASRATGRHWLFFGERYRNCLFYELLWQQCAQELQFKASFAFSRETLPKVYVQDRMREHSEELSQWLERATLYVCGDAKQMAKDVERAILDIFIAHRGCDEAGARLLLKAMREEGRYLRDVY